MKRDKRLQYQINFMENELLKKGWKYKQAFGVGSDIYNSSNHKITKDDYAVTIIFTKKTEEASGST